MSRPLVYYAISVFLGCFCFVGFEYNVFFGAAIVASFFSIMLFTINKKEFLMVILFFIIGGFNFYNYYNAKIPPVCDLRVVDNRGKYCVGEYENRKIYIWGNIYDLKSGEKIKAQGEFIKKLDYKKGFIGTYKIRSYEKKGKDIVFRIYNMKENLFEKYEELLGKDKASLIMGVCYGETKYLSLDEKENFKQLGISHIISVSGFHLALVYEALQRVLSVQISLIVTFIYLIFTGAKAATIRAYIMILVLKLSKVVYRNYDSISALSLSALILLMIRPYYITDVGFNLSFLATLGIILYNKKIKRVLYKLPKKINESLSMTLSSQVFSMPYVMCALNDVSMFFIPANLVLIPLYSMLVFAGNISVFFINTPVLKTIAVSMLYSITTVIQGGNYLLLKISPPIYQYNYFYGIALLCMIMSILLYKNRYTYFKYFPGIVFGFIIIYNVL